MILPDSKDAIHKMQLYRLLTEILDNPILVQHVYFKGGTCAAMLGFLDRFSIDLDFDIKENIGKEKIKAELSRIFHQLELVIDQQSKHELFYLLKYQSNEGERNTIKLSLITNKFRHNMYAPYFLKEIDRSANCQTVETMFSHKLVSLTDRYKKYKMIAGRDLYDIHHFFLKGFKYSNLIIQERTGKEVKLYLQELKAFIKKNINEHTLSQDLNYLLPPEKFKKIRKTIIRETLVLLEDEIKRIQFRIKPL